MDRKTFGIGILSLSALVLLVANLWPHTTVQAATVIKDRDYQMVTARNAQGGESLYVVDDKTGLMAVFVYDPTTRSLTPRAVRPVTDAFSGR